MFLQEAFLGVGGLVDDEGSGMLPVFIDKEISKRRS